MRVGPASETLDTLAAEGKRFDLAFLDADKTGYLGYYKKARHTHRMSITLHPVLTVNLFVKVRIEIQCCVKMVSHEWMCCAAHGPQSHSS